MAKSYTELFKNINKAIRTSLEDNVLTEIKGTMQKNIHTHVYNAYMPKEYSRKKDSGGLSDPDNIVFDKEQLKSNRLKIRSIREAINQDTGNFVDVAKIVQTGKGYTRKFPFNGVARNYTKITKDEIRRKKIHIKALQKGLRVVGLKVRD